MKALNFNRRPGGVIPVSKKQQKVETPLGGKVEELAEAFKKMEETLKEPEIDIPGEDLSPELEAVVQKAERRRNYNKKNRKRNKYQKQRNDRQQEAMNNLVGFIVVGTFGVLEEELEKVSIHNRTEMINNIRKLLPVIRKFISHTNGHVRRDLTGELERWFSNE